MRDYSRRFLTCPRDKLVAIDGIAQAVQRVVKCDYVAGLWSSNLLYGISWSRECGKDTMDMTLPPHVFHIEYRAPTWSWASIDGALGYYTPASGDSLISNAEIVSWDVRTFDDTQFGQVKDGSLQIRGHLIPGILNREPTEEDYNLGFRALEPDLIVEPNNWRLVPDVNLQILPYLDIDGKQSWSVCRYLGLIPSLSTERDDVLTETDSDRLEDARVWLLYLGYFTYIGYTKTTHMFLLLGISLRDSRSYERIKLASNAIYSTSRLYKLRYL